MHPVAAELRSIIGRRWVLTGAERMRPFTQGYRFGAGEAVAVACPGSLVELWRVLRACVAADVIVIAQAANTGLTGGSTPQGSYDRPVVVISTRRICGIRLLRGGEQVVCLAGTTLHQLEQCLAPIGREPHSVIGSSCIGASVVGGVCNSSGGTLVQRGPAFTQYALYARVDEDGRLQLHDRLGLDLSGGPEEILQALDRGTGIAPGIVDDSRAASAASAYAEHVRQVDACTPARFNADPDRLFEASGSAGRIVVFAVRLDTFAREEEQATFYIGSNDTAELAALRRTILTDFAHLPISGEYIHRDAFDIAAVYGKDVFLAIRRFGTARLPALFALRHRIDRLAARTGLLPANFADRLLQWLSGLFPQHLPLRMRQFRDRFEHHLVIKMGGGGVAEARERFAQMFPSSSGDMFECTGPEAQSAFLHRFAVAGAAVRYRAIHDAEIEDIVALDIALRRNDADWFERLPDDVAEPIVHALYYGHFFCHVLHQDYLVRKGTDAEGLEHRMWALLDARGAEYPAEHNVGHLYPAKPALVDHYRQLDPGNRFNPGIGRTSRARDWR